jgi:signal transduction histidine kinase/ligand-binding sensor domain-containing protein
MISGDYRWPRARRHAAEVRLASCSLLATALLGVAAAAPVGTNSPDFLIDNWQADDGLPQSSVLSIVQTPEGYLWLATYGGLARFDGVRFTIFDASTVPGLPANRLTRLHVDSAGGLWVVTEHHDLVRIAAGRCRAFGPADGLPTSGVDWVGGEAETKSEGNPKPEAGLGGGDAPIHLPEGLWVADPEGGLHCARAGRFASVLAAPGFGTESRVSGLQTDDEGRVWIKQGERLACFEAGKFTVLKTPQGEEAVVKGVCASREGGSWIVTPEGVRKYRHREWQSGLWPCPDFKSHLEGTVEDGAGNLWLATYRNGLFRFSRNGVWEQFTAESGLTTSALRSLFCDREGNLWVGTDGGGLLRIKPRGWKMITRREGLGIDAVHSISQDQQGRIWFGGGTTKPYWLDQGVVSVAIPSPVSDPMDGVFSVLSARDGAMWIGIYREKVFHYQGGVLACYSASEGMRAGSVRAMLEDRRGAIWVGGFSGLCRIQDGQAVNYSRAEGLSAERVTALAENSRGDLFVGTSGGGLNRLREGEFTVYTRRDGLPDDTIGGLYVDAQDTLWIGTRNGGLSRFREGRFTNYAANHAVPARRIGPILEDDQGSLWLASEQGILRVSRQELNQFADGKRRSVNYVAFDRSDGLATTEVGGIQPACLKARDGKLWFGTPKGAAFVDPKEVRVNPLPPPVIIDEVRIDDEVVNEQRSEAGGQEAKDGRAVAPRSPVTLSPPSLVTLQPHQRRVEFRFTGLSLTAPAKVRFRYQMEGFDPDWVDGGTTRNASYTRLPPGRYRFHVIACNNDSVWNETGASLGLRVLPSWWQTWWCRALALVSAGGFGFGFYEWRIHLLKRRRAAQQEFSRRLIASQESERQRIAAELHDGLGQHLLVIKNMAALGVRFEPDDPARTERFTAISSLASQAVGEVRNIARALRPFELDRLGLTKALTWLIKPAGESSNIRFEVEVDELGGVFPPEFEINLYRVVQEGLANILKHSQATTACVRIKRQPPQVQVTIQDNGRGFVVPAPDGLSASKGMGLTDMAERVHIMGGQLAIESAPDAGTRLHILIPLKGSRRPSMA